jgi:hypothetical protein
MCQDGLDGGEEARYCLLRELLSAWVSLCTLLLLPPVAPSCHMHAFRTALQSQIAALTCSTAPRAVNSESASSEVRSRGSFSSPTCEPEPDAIGDAAILQLVLAVLPRAEERPRQNSGSVCGYTVWRVGPCERKGDGWRDGESSAKCQNQSRVKRVRILSNLLLLFPYLHVYMTPPSCPGHSLKKSANVS